MRAAVRREVQSELGADEEQLFLDMILFDRPDDFAGWQIARDRAPRPAPVVALEHIGMEIPRFVSIEHRKDRVRIMQRCLDVVDERQLGYTGNLHGAPVAAAVLAHLDQPVVGSDVD